MLKRFQILLTDWQEEYLRYICEKHDYSFSEALRILLSEGIFHMILSLSPKYKPGITKKQIAEMLRKVARISSTQEERYRFISLLYFEAHKAADFRLSKTKNKIRK